MSDKKKLALELVGEAINELESSKGCIATGIQKLFRASTLLEDHFVAIWCEIVLGHKEIGSLIQKAIDASEAYQKNKEDTELADKLDKATQELKQFNIDIDAHINPTFQFMADEAAGGLKGIKFIEDTYEVINKKKHQNDGTHYLSNLKQHMEAVRNYGLVLAQKKFDKLKFSGTTQNSFEILKTLIDDKLLDLEPELAEQLMLVFKSVSSDNKEEWSQAAVTCRRLFEKLADRLYPAREEKVKGRDVKQNNYINRIWMFMDEAISSETNKELAKSHVDLIGSLMQRIYKLTNKGTHEVKGEITQVEVVKMVFHTYLMLADLLEYLDQSHFNKIEKLSISKASIADLEAVLGVSNKVAKDIIRERVKNGGSLSFEQLVNVSGVGQKTIEKAKEFFLG